MSRQRLSRSLNLGVLILTAGVIAVDASTKWWARQQLAGGVSHVVGPLWLRLTFNSGVSFSISRDSPTVSLVVAMVVAVGLLTMALRAQPGVATWGLGLLLGGGLANVGDRLLASPPRVTDFIAVGRFPVFNMADVAVSVGFLLLLLLVLRGKRMVVPW